MNIRKRLLSILGILFVSAMLVGTIASVAAQGRATKPTKNVSAESGGIDRFNLPEGTVPTELKATIEEFGDDRRSPLVSRGESKAFSEEELMTTETITGYRCMVHACRIPSISTVACITGIRG